MTTRRALLLGSCALLAGAVARRTRAAAPIADGTEAHWELGRHYFPVQPEQQTGLPAGKIGLTEIFSYGCPACNAFLPYMQSLERKLPGNVVIDYLPASWNPSEDWPLFQRAWFTAKALGVAGKTHAAMFHAIWQGGELAIVDSRTQQLKRPLPDIEDVARFYQRVAGVPAGKFVQTSRSFSIDLAMNRADARIKAAQAEYTPTLMVNGKYRADTASAGGSVQLVALAEWLVAREAS